MTEKTENPQRSKGPVPAVQPREARLKAALKANMARRKAQAKARGAEKNSVEAVPGGESGPDQE